MGLSQEKLADVVGVTFQQVQKYERGTNRISASRLFKFSKALQVSIDYFYDGLERVYAGRVPQSGMADNDQDGFETVPAAIGKDLPEDIMTRKETIDLVRTYYSIEDVKGRRRIMDLIKSATKILN